MKTCNIAHEWILLSSNGKKHPTDISFLFTEEIKSHGFGMT